MGPQKEGGDVWFSIAEAARILQVKPQALYMAISERRLPSGVGPRGKRIHVSDLVAFGIQRGSDPSDLLQRIQKESEADDWDILVWLLGGLGLVWLISTLLKKK